MKDSLKHNLIFTVLGFSCFSQQPKMFFQTSTRNFVSLHSFKNLILGLNSRQKWNQQDLLISKRKRTKRLKVLDPQHSALMSTQNCETDIQQLPKTQLWFLQNLKTQKFPIPVKTLKVLQIIWLRRYWDFPLLTFSEMERLLGGI